LFVGTKKQAQEAIAEQAMRVGQPYVNQRWLGGMLTNFQTMHQRLQRMKELEEIDFDDVAGSSRTKKELLQMRREKDKLDRTLGGIRDMGRVPAAVWVVDTNKEHLAVDEARKLGIPVVAILDSNCDPDMVDYPVPGNDDAIRSVTLLTRVVADAVADGLMARAGATSGDEGPGEELGAEEPLPEWERALLEGEADKKPAEGSVAESSAPADAGAPSVPAAESAVAVDEQEGATEPESAGSTPADASAATAAPTAVPTAAPTETPQADTTATAADASEPEAADTAAAEGTESPDTP
ncbi:MAG: 30S ribosomal protein S2, partial [Nocardioidaceae bacterium]